MFRYSSRQIILHWLVVLLLAFQFLANEPIAQAFRNWMREGQKVLSGGVAAHLAVGVAILLLAIWRLALRRSSPAAPREPGVLGLLARAVHGLFYLLLILIPASGLTAWIAGIRTVAGLHGQMATLLLMAVALHVVGALFHQFVLKDGLLNRMLPGRGV